MPNIFIETLGCKINQYESACILDEYLQAGYQKADDINNADIIIINTCTVTNRTDYKSRYLINKAKQAKIKKNAKIIVTGCYSQRNREEIEALGFVDLIVDNNSKDINMNTTSMDERSRAYLKIQDGCDFFCSYCAVPYARGKPRDRSLESIIKQVKILLDNGYEELVLSGINLGLFKDLHGLLYELAKYDKLKRIRLSSIEPQLFTEKLLKAIGYIDKICPHFHIPLQSGSDTLLKLHGRKYTTTQFLNIVERLQQLKPYTALGFDVIVGLPHETDELFQETYQLLKNLDLTYLHVFIYSKRKGTPAATMPNQVHGTAAKERSKQLIELGKIKKKAYIATLINNHIPLYATPETYNEKKKLWHGTSDRYVKAYFKVETPYMVSLLPQHHYLDGVYCETT
jgi:threonylcarbamoyladenosine tRNA methylthiotransferase MtaB